MAASLSLWRMVPYYAVETEAAEGFQVDPTPHYFEVEGGKTVSLTVTNKAFSGILIHKIDTVSREGICDVTFLLYDSNKNPIGQYTSDDRGYVYIDDLPSSGRYYLRELENEGYIVDEQLKTVYVTDGTTTEITWENTRHHRPDSDHQNQRGLQLHERLARRDAHSQHGV